MLDVVIKNGKIIDGSGNPWFLADLGIQGEKIVQVRHNIKEETESAGAPQDAFETIRPISLC